jgi:hypothetical protein
MQVNAGDSPCGSGVAGRSAGIHSACRGIDDRHTRTATPDRDVARSWGSGPDARSPAKPQDGRIVCIVGTGGDVWTEPAEKSDQLGMAGDGTRDEAGDGTRDERMRDTITKAGMSSMLGDPGAVWVGGAAGEV